MTTSESEWQQRVTDLARSHGWRHFHVHDSRKSVAGWPDLVLLRGDRLIFAELKSATGRVSPAQQEWLAALEAVERIEVALWRPRDRAAVEQALRRRDERTEP